MLRYIPHRSYNDLNSMKPVVHMRSGVGRNLSYSLVFYHDKLLLSGPPSSTLLILPSTHPYALYIWFEVGDIALPYTAEKELWLLLKEVLATSVAI
jgi:hypothetical protein